MIGFRIRDYEWHLSFKEVPQVNKAFIETNKKFLKDKRFSIHLPDYVSSNHLIDPFSSNERVGKQSKDLISSTNIFAERLQELTGERVLLLAVFLYLMGIGKFFTSVILSLFSHPSKLTK